MPVNTTISDKAVPARAEVLADVKQIVAEFTSVPLVEIEERHDLFTDLGYDSLDIVEATMEVEEHFSISVPDDQAEPIRTVGGIVDGVLRLLTA
jgi:acyl carrier protein